MRVIAHLLNQLPQLEWMHVKETLGQFETTLAAQVYFSTEAAQLLEFSHSFRHWKSVHFPSPVFPLVQDSVLVETFEEGRPIMEYIENGDHPLNKPLAKIVVTTILKMMLIDHRIHADLHPGNILVREEADRLG